MGALMVLTKPVSAPALERALGGMVSFLERREKRLLVVEDDQVQRAEIVNLIGNGEVITTAVASGREALEALRNDHFDCMVLDLKLPDVSGFELLETIQKEGQWRDLPIIIYTASELGKRDETKLKRVAQTIVVKDARSPERLLDETALYLHRPVASLPSEQRRILEELHQTEADLGCKRVLIIDDDIRNIFALTSVLEHHGLKVLSAESGKEGIETLQKTPEVDLVLMDIMMPEMDGFEAIRTIRRMRSFQSLPIIALTAKAMKGDREKCLESGASDYIAKPVDTQQLLSLLRLWVNR